MDSILSQGANDNRHVVSILVDNKPGVLQRVIGLVSRRGFNIHSLAVAPTETPELSRITLVVNAEGRAYEQIFKQLNKVISVHKVVDMTQGDALVREIAFIQVDATPEQRDQIMQTAAIFHGKVVDVGVSSLIIEVSGEPAKIHDLESLLAPYGVRQTIRSGRIATPRLNKE